MRVQRKATIEGAIQKLSRKGIGAPAAPLAVAAGAWTLATLQNSWEWWGAGLAKPAYRVGADGRIYLRGEVKKAAGAAGTTIFTLPVGLRPKELTINAAWSAGGTVRVEVLSTGAVVYGGASSAVGDLSLDQISFYPD